MRGLFRDLSDANMARELAHLAQSDFRARFRLNAKDRETAQTKGDALLRQHVLEIITDAEKAFVIELIIAWIRADLAKPAKPERSKKTKKDVSPQPELF